MSLFRQTVRQTVRLLLLPLSLLAAGCGGEPDSEPEKPPLVINACALFTADDAKAIAGEVSGTMSSTFDKAKGGDPGQCVYISGSAAAPRVLSLQVRQFPTSKAAARTHEGSRSTLERLSRGNLQEVPGLGDGALWVGGALQQMHVLRKNLQLVITIQSTEGQDQKAAAQGVAAKALERLQGAGL
jgi:hypothetical protein